MGEPLEENVESNPEPVEQVDPPEDQEDQGFPEGTPVAEMTDLQRAAYWQSHSRGHEKNEKKLFKAKQLADKQITEMQTQLEEHKRSKMSEQEAAIADAKTSARAETLQEVGAKQATTLLTWALRARGIEPDSDEFNAVFDAVDVNRFVSGEDVDAERIEKYAGIFGAGKGAKPYQNPREQGHGAGDRSSSSASGGELKAQYDLLKGEW